MNTTEEQRQLTPAEKRAITIRAKQKARHQENLAKIRSWCDGLNEVFEKNGTTASEFANTPRELLKERYSSTSLVQDLRDLRDKSNFSKNI